MWAATVTAIVFAIAVLSPQILAWVVGKVVSYATKHDLTIDSISLLRMEVTGINFVLCGTVVHNASIQLRLRQFWSNPQIQPCLVTVGTATITVVDQSKTPVPVPRSSQTSGGLAQLKFVCALVLFRTVRFSVRDIILIKKEAGLSSLSCRISDMELYGTMLTNYCFKFKQAQVDMVPATCANNITSVGAVPTEDSDMVRMVNSGVLIKSFSTDISLSALKRRVTALSVHCESSQIVLVEGDLERPPHLRPKGATAPH